MPDLLDAPLHDDACDCPACQAREADARPDAYVVDARGQRWLRCGPACDLEPREDGGVRCRCHE